MAEIIVSSNAEKRKSGSQHSKATKIEFNFTWKIDNFAFKTRVMKNGEFLDSEPFSADGSKDVQWQLLCHPKGDSRDMKGFGCFVVRCYPKGDSKELNGFGCFVRILKFCGPKLMMEANFCILDLNGTVLYSRLFQTTLTKFPALWGWPNFVSQKDLLEKYVKEDSLTLNCKLTYEVENNISLQAKVPRLEEPDEDHITRQLGVLLNTGRMSDISFVIERQKFKAHKNILSTRSQIFSEMFEINGMVSPLETLKIEDCEPKVFEAMLRFIYTDEISETEEIAKKLLPLAKKYQVKLLQKKCEEILLNYISTENCAEMLLLADTQEALLLKKDALDYFRHHSGEIFKTTGWKTLRQTRPHLGVEIFEFTAS